MQLNTLLQIVNIRDEGQHVVIYCEIAQHAQVEKQFDEILKIIRKDLTELVDYNQPSDHYNISEVFCTIGMDHLVIQLLSEEEKAREAAY